MTKREWLSNPVKGLLLDISGVLKDGDVAISGSVEAIKRLQTNEVPFRLLTNETLKSRSTVTNTLNSLGFKISEADIFHPVPALKEVLAREKLRPHLLLHERMLTEFMDVDVSNPNCVVMGDAQQYFTYENLNKCFRLLMDMKEPIFITLGLGKYYMDDDGLALDVGAYCAGLEYATGITPRVIGKPSCEYFQIANEALRLTPGEVVMIGDDIQFDVGGAQKCGMRGVLVRTGKFLPSDENHPTVKPDGIVDNLKEAVDLILSN